MRRVPPAIAIACPLAIASAIVAAQAWEGPIVLSLSAAHGVDTGDLLAFPLVLLAIAAARSRLPSGRRAPDDRAVRAPALVLGVLLLLGCVVTSGGGPLVPAAGGTLDGTIKQTVASQRLSVGRWTHVALTYDGADERLYLNGEKVSSSTAKGRIQAPANPLWIGGNRPYGEHFLGVIDDVRVYDRPLSEREIRADMATPVRPARGLVAGYGFDTSSRRTATDASGSGNTGEIRGGARLAPGRHGGGLRLDGKTGVVRVAPSASLNLIRAMTLSAWVRPGGAQKDWRTIVQRQTDAYFLAASTSRLKQNTALDNLRTWVVAAVAAWLAFVVATGRGPAAATRRRSWWLPVVLFVAGSFADAALSPSGTLIGSILVALWLAATAESRAERLTFSGLAVIGAGVTMGVLAAGEGLSHYEGATARTAALGSLLVIGALVRKLPSPASVLSFNGRRMHGSN
jgi:hypothetical protein